MKKILVVLLVPLLTGSSCPRHLRPLPLQILETIEAQQQRRAALDEKELRLRELELRLSKGGSVSQAEGIRDE